MRSNGQLIWNVPIWTTATTEEVQAQPPNLMLTSSVKRNAEFWFLILLLKFNKTSVKKCNLGFYQWLVHCSGNSPFIIIFWHTSLCQNAYCQPWTFKEEARNKTAICLSMHYIYLTNLKWPSFVVKLILVLELVKMTRIISRVINHANCLSVSSWCPDREKISCEHRSIMQNTYLANDSIFW